MALFDRSAATYDDWCQTPLGSFVDTLETGMMLALARPHPRESAIDLGCGTGIYSLLLAQHQVRVTGVDASPEMLKQARRKADQQRLIIDFQEADLRNLPFPDEQFELAICNVVLEFVEQPGEVIAEAMRVLKKGGRLVAGLIGKQSEWAAKYAKQGKEKSNSVFAEAHFYSAEEISRFHAEPPAEIRYGLYLKPNEFVSVEQAFQIERQRSVEQSEAGAGFITVRWNR